MQDMVVEVAAWRSLGDVLGQVLRAASDRQKAPAHRPPDSGPHPVRPGPELRAEFGRARRFHQRRPASEKASAFSV